MLRDWTTIARDSRVGAPLPSITRAPTPRRCSTRPAISPVGPAPTTSSSVSSRRVVVVVSMAGLFSTRRRVGPAATVDPFRTGRQPGRPRCLAALPAPGPPRDAERAVASVAHTGVWAAEATARWGRALRAGRGAGAGAALAAQIGAASGGGAGQLAAASSAVLPREVRRGGQVHLDDGVEVPVRPGGGVLRGAGGAGEVAQARALVAEHDEMLLRGVRTSMIGVLHGVSPLRSAQGRPDVLVPA